MHLLHRTYGGGGGAVKIWILSSTWNLWRCHTSPDGFTPVEPPLLPHKRHQLGGAVSLSTAHGWRWAQVPSLPLDGGCFPGWGNPHSHVCVCSLCHLLNTSWYHFRTVHISALRVLVLVKINTPHPPSASPPLQSALWLGTVTHMLKTKVLRTWSGGMVLVKS